METTRIAFIHRVGSTFRLQTGGWYYAHRELVLYVGESQHEAVERWIRDGSITPVPDRA